MKTIFLPRFDYSKSLSNLQIIELSIIEASDNRKGFPMLLGYKKKLFFSRIIAVFAVFNKFAKG